jgi:hypothetical protein
MTPTNNLPEKNQFLLYTTPAGDVKIEVLFENESIWLTQKKMAELFDVDVRTVNEHLKNIFNSSELLENSVIRKIRTTAADEKKYETNFYNLDAIISVGYRVNSEKATHFRIWATKALRDFIIKGFMLDDERLKNGSHFGLNVNIKLLADQVKRFYHFPMTKEEFGNSRF